MEYTGIRLGLAVLKKMSADMADSLVGLEKRFTTWRAGDSTSPRPSSSARSSSRRSASKRQEDGHSGQASTDRQRLKSWPARSIIASGKLLEHPQDRQAQRATYVDALPNLGTKRPGRVHASFNQTWRPRRLSSSDPNLQNIPIRSELGGKFAKRSCRKLAGLSLPRIFAIELRLFAHFCEDEELQRSFAEERDIIAG